MSFSAYERWLCRMTGIPVNECLYWEKLASHFVSRQAGSNCDPRTVQLKMQELYKNSGNSRRA
jgi:hypothetical protein